MNILAINREEIEKLSFLIVNELAYSIFQEGIKRYLFAVDLRKPKNTATFIYRRKSSNFDIYECTFKDNKRKYEMLYLLERNTSDIVKVWNSNRMYY